MGRYDDIDPQDINPDTGAPYPGYSSPCLDTTLHDIEMDIEGDDDTPVRCDNCDWRGLESEVLVARDLAQRVDPGGVMPVGECPECGALAYFTD